MLSAQRGVHVVAADRDLISLLDNLSILNSGHHGGFPTAPADGLNLFDLICVHQEIVGSFEQLILKIIFQSVGTSKLSTISASSCT